MLLVSFATASQEGARVLPIAGVLSPPRILGNLEGTECSELQDKKKFAALGHIVY